MGLDAWGVKLKNNEEWMFAHWDNLEDFKKKEIIPKSNYFYKECYDNRFHRFMKQEILKNKDFSFYGDPCCSREILKNTVEALKEWINNNPNKNWEDTETWVDYTEITTKEEIKDLLEYLTILDKNDCVMWFSD